MLLVRVEPPGPGALASGEPGLTDWLAGEVSRESLARPVPGTSERVAQVSMGRLAAQGIQRLDLLNQGLEAWGRDHDFVLCDLPSLLLHADVELLIPTLGQVFLVVEAEAVNRGEVARARRLLEKLDATAVGLLVTQVPIFKGSGYMEPLIAETLTRLHFPRFLTQPRWQLHWQVLRTQLARWHPRRALSRRPRKNP